MVKLAFPSNDDDGCTPGMTLRDYYAGLALQGLLANPDTDFETRGDYARAAVAFADELLLALR